MLRVHRHYVRISCISYSLPNFKNTRTGNKHGSTQHDVHGLCTDIRREIHLRMWGAKVTVRPKVAVVVKTTVRPKVTVSAQYRRVMLLQNFLIENVLPYTF